MIDLSLMGHGGSFRATVVVPGDKSLSHRALVFSAMAEGDSLITGLGTGHDIKSTASALRSLGVDIDGDKVRSPGVRGWTGPADPIDCGNSGTTMRLLAGILSTSGLTATLIGDSSLMARPMRRLVPPLSALGARLEVSPEGRPPLRILESGTVHGASVTIPIASAQVRTAFELAALAGDSPSMIDSPGGFRDHTERWLTAIGLGEWKTATAFSVSPGSIPPARYEVPGDPSSAAYLWACAAIHPSSSVTTPTISLNPGRLGFLEILERMGARVDAVVTGETGGDPVGDVTVSSADLNGISIEGDLVAAALDELPLVAVVAAYADGITSVRGAGELRAKESDRISSVVGMILALGGGVAEHPDGFDVIGTGFLEAGTVETNNDHRIAMSAAVAATRIDTPVIVRNAQIASVSWPGFYETLERLWS